MSSSAPASRAHWTVGAFAAFGAFVWATRLRNISGDDLSGSALVIRAGLAAYLLLLSAAVGVAWWTASRLARPVTRATVVATVLVWVPRAVAIGVDPEHGTAFKVVHAVLALVSLVLATLAWRAVNRWSPADHQHPVAAGA
ncbi:MAG TPA: hypothetical protein VGA13_12825 [Acidimicrobiales bacterium]|jgi:hypothetical protein